MRRWIGVLALAALFAAGQWISLWTRARPATGPSSLLFEESAAAAGIAVRHETLTVHPSLKPWQKRLAAIGASVAVVDWDGDGWMDLYVPNSRVGSVNRLYHNNRDGTYTDTAERAGLAHLNQTTGSMQALFFDTDNDGDPDLVLGTHRGLRYFRSERGFYREVQPAAELDTRRVSSLNVLDLDGDGFLDLVAGVYARAHDLQEPGDYTALMPSVLTFKKHPGRVELFRNEGGQRFTRLENAVPVRRGLPLALGVADLHGDGATWLHVGTDFWFDALYRLQDGRLRDHSRAVFQNYSRNGMSSVIGDVNGDGRAEIFVSNIHFQRWKPGGNLIWSPGKNGSLKDIAEKNGLRDCGWSWGAKFADLDNDGDLDLYVANGQVTGSGRSYIFPAGVILQAAPSIQLDVRNWPPFEDSDYFGHQRDCLFINEKGRFEEQGEPSGIDDLLDGRAVAILDERNDGRLSVVVASQGQPLRLYRPSRAPAPDWIGFSLKGTRGPRDAHGAYLELVLDDGSRLTRELRPANGFMSQSDSRLHVGLGRGKPVLARLRWPGGKVTTLADPAPGRYHRLVEPSR